MIFPSFLALLGGVILIDLILSGDNALVIGAVAAPITPRRRRWIALAFGGLLAIILRITFTISASFLLDIPYIQAIGGITIAIIAFRLIPDVFPISPETTHPADKERLQTNDISGPLPPAAQHISNWTSRKIRRLIPPDQRTFLMAVLTITIADITMSLDNILAIGALAHGNALVLTIGLSLSILLLLVSSAFVAEFMSRFPKLILVASIILSWVAGDLIWNNVAGFFRNNQYADWYHVGLGLLMIILVHVAAAIYILRRRRRARIRTRRQTSADATLHHKRRACWSKSPCPILAHTKVGVCPPLEQKVGIGTSPKEPSFA